MIGKLLLGLLILMAACVVAQPAYAEAAWALAMSALWFIFWIVILIIIAFTVLGAIAIYWGIKHE